MSDTESVVKEASSITVHDELEVEPGVWSEIGAVETAEVAVSGGRLMTRIELLVIPDKGATELIVPSTLPLHVRA